MHYLITGGTGFIGTALCAALIQQGHKLIICTRNKALKSTDTICYVKRISLIHGDTPIDGIINLAGEPIANGRWTPKKKQTLLDSRLKITEALVELCHRLAVKPKVFISGSAIGYYGSQAGNDKLDELSAFSDSFSHQLCAKWERAALEAKKHDIRVCLLRTGIVLESHGGALKKMLPPFKLGMGGKIASGEQWMSWIHLQDMVRIILFCLENENIHGPVNATAPNPVINQDFVKVLADALNKPHCLTTPAFALTLLFGEMAKELLITGQRVVPSKLLEAGFEFEYPFIKQAMEAVVGKKT